MSKLLGNADLTKIYTKKDFQLGTQVEDVNGCRYHFIKYNAGDGAVTGAAGLAVFGLDGAYPAFEATVDGDSATIPVLLNRPFGILQAALTDGAYGWAQIAGIGQQDLTTGGGVAQGELLIGTTGDGVVDGVAANAVTQKTLGEATEADVSTVLAAGDYIVSIAGL